MTGGLSDRARRASRFAEESGAATVLAVAILGAVVALGVAAVGVLGASVASQSAANAADASALAAADAVSGAVAGEPCTLAGDLARRNGATLVRCRIEGPVAVVSVEVAVGPVRATAGARAGPPGWAG
ncbi:Rv3654c family TadE-like protein [Agromyces binzhouensis]|uniref:Rv3654c family TadE-like protein n=1 Tax=Agromyces binzhouensis TaxID=1817495 RepID=UPI0036305B39